MAATYLVTGGAGFIGSHLTEALLSRGDRIIVLDDLSTGDLANLSGVFDERGLRVVEGSVLDAPLVDDLAGQCDVIVHLAAAVGVKLIVEQPLRSFVNNLKGSETVVEAADRHRRQLLMASTSEVYGKSPDVPMAEGADRVLGSPEVSRWAYSTAKVVDEILACVYHRERGLHTTVVRLFNTVGPRQSPAYGMVVPRLVRQAVAGQPLTVHGDGLQTRCFCHVADVVDGIVRLLDHPAAAGQIVNVGSNEEVSILELARRIGEHTGNGFSIDLVPYDIAYPDGFEDLRRRVPDIAKMGALTGWRPTRALDDILAETIAEAAAERRATV